MEGGAMDAELADDRRVERTIFGHPIRLVNLFGVELWETKLAPQAFRAQMMALYFFSVGLGTSMSGVLAKYYDPAHEFAYFGVLGVVAIVVGLVVFGLSGWISRLMEGVH